MSTDNTKDLKVMPLKLYLLDRFVHAESKYLASRMMFSSNLFQVLVLQLMWTTKEMCIWSTSKESYTRSNKINHSGTDKVMRPSMLLLVEKLLRFGKSIRPMGNHINTQVQNGFKKENQQRESKLVNTLCRR